MKSGRVKRILLSVIAFLFVGCSIAGGTVLLSNTYISDSNRGGDSTPSENELTKNAPTNSDLWTASGNYATAFDNEGEAGIDGTTEEKAYEIRTAEQLALLAYRVNNSSTNSTYRSLYYVQTADIDLSLYYWDAIGYSSSYNFSGCYDGGGFVISGLYTKAGTTSAYNYQGLFGYVRGTSSAYASIQNIGLVDSQIEGYFYCGAVIGYSYYTNISECFNAAIISSTGAYVGGVVGYTSYTSIRDCYNIGTVTGSSSSNGYIGGVVGGNVAEVIDCYNTGAVTGHYYYVGGVVGGSADPINCYNTGTVVGKCRVGGVIGGGISSGNIVTNCYNAGNVIGTTCVGGVAGLASDIASCYNTGSVTGESGSTDNGFGVGGIVGAQSGVATVVITNCYNTGTITVDGNNNRAGGIVGNASSYQSSYNTSCFVTITNCYNTGTVTTVYGCSAGGILGEGSSTSYTSSRKSFFTIYNCYNSGAVRGGYYNGGVVGCFNYDYNITNSYFFPLSITNCYYGGNCTLLDGVGNSSYTGVSKNSNLIANAKSLSWYQDSSNWNSNYPWDFEEVWMLVNEVNNGYPILKTSPIIITYDSNNGTGNVLIESKNSDENYVIRGNPFIYDGYRFVGWNNEANGNGESYIEGDLYLDLTNLTLYAQWERMVYTVTFDANGGSGTMSSVEKIYNEDLVLPANEFTKTGYNFKGWATSANGSVVYGDGAKYTTNVSATLYAVWESMVIAVNLDVNSGSGGTSTIYLKYDSGWYSSSSCTSSSKITSLPSTPTRTGYEFKGYSTEPDGSGTLAVSETGAINVSDTFYSTDGTRTWYAVWEARNPAYYDSEGGYWYVENGKLPQSKVSESLKATLEGQWSSLTDGSIYYMGVEELADGDLTTDSGMQSKVYNGEEYVKFNGEYYLVEPIRWRLVYSSSQQEGYAVENTSVLATMAEIVFLGSYSSTKIGVGEGYSTESVTMLLKNQVSDDYLVNDSREVEIFGTPKDTTTASGSVFVASSEELANFTTSKNNTTGSGVKAGKVSFSDFVRDYLRATGQGDYYFTRDLGDQLNTIRCLNPVGDRSQAKAQQTLGVQFTVKITEYACKSV